MRLSKSTLFVAVLVAVCGVVVQAQPKQAPQKAVAKTSSVQLGDKVVVIPNPEGFEEGSSQFKELRDRFQATESPQADFLLAHLPESECRLLRNGGALLIFPRGSIEPDPAWMPHPDAEFDHWSRSLEIFMQRVPQLQILITIASGVISKSAMRHPLTWFRRNRPDRQRLAFLYQLARQMLSGKEIFGLTPRITFGEMIAGENHEHMLAEIEQSARRVLLQHMAGVHV